MTQFEPLEAEIYIMSSFFLHRNRNLLDNENRYDWRLLGKIFIFDLIRSRLLVLWKLDGMDDWSVYKKF